MKQKRLSIVIIPTIVIAFIGIVFYSNPSSPSISSEKINGVNFVAPKEKVDESAFKSLETVNANWVAIIPYAYTPKNSKEVIFYKNHAHWWGEGVEGVISQITMAKNLGLKIMLKPHVWVLGEGWAGDFVCQNEEEWEVWEESYKKYILTYAQLCDSLNVNLFCFSTEYCKVVQIRPQFWAELIRDIKKVYDGPLTYAANWDNYKNIQFWDEVDYIGIDAYFPLSDLKNPSLKELNTKWEDITKELSLFSEEKNKKILFTEFGYRSCDYTTKEPWLSHSSQSINFEAQENAFISLFQSVWDFDWMQGGFVWKWHANHASAGGKQNSKYTPQNKPAELVIKRYYSGQDSWKN